MTKQLALDKSFAQVGTVDFDEGIIFSITGAMNQSGCNFFPYAGISKEQYSGIRFGRFFYEMTKFLDGRAFPD